MTEQPTLPPSAENDKLDFKIVLPIFAIVFVDLLGLTIIIPVLPYYATAFGANALMIGALSAAYPLMQFIGGPLLGGLSDRFGRKPVLIVSQIGTLAGFIVMGFASSLWLLFLARLIDGLSGGNIATAQAALTDVTTPRNRAQGLGLIGAAFGLGFIIGPVISAITLSLSGNDYRIPAFVAAGFSLLAITLTALIFRETLPADKRHAQAAAMTQNPFSRMLQAARHPMVGILFVVIFMQQVVFGSFQSMFAPFTLNRLGLNSVGNAAAFTFVGVIIVIVQGRLIGPLSRRFGERRLIYTGLGLLAIGLVVMALIPRQPAPWYDREALIEELNSARSIGAASEGVTQTEPAAIELPDESSSGWLGIVWLLATLIPIAAGSSILQPSASSLITKRVDRREVGSILGVNAAFLSAANTIGPLLGGAAFSLIGPPAPFLVGGILMALLLWLALRRVRPGPEENLQQAAA
ncbi:MAG: MFS transporter [Burkholderiales bacterium]|nr:MFS transporter [Anaerolineae bacterium]